MDNTFRSYSHLSRRLIAINSKFQVYFDTLSMPGGQTIDDYLIISPRIRTRQDIVGVCVLPYFDNKFWLMKSWRHHSGHFIWQAPSGFVEPNEDLSYSASRELYEESGFLSDSANLIPIGSFYPDPGLIDGSVALFLGTNILQPVTLIESEVGLGELFPFTNEELLDLAINSPNIGGATLAACFRSLTYIKRHKM